MLQGPFSLTLTSDVVYKIFCEIWTESYNGECVRHLTVRGDEHIGMSPLTNKRVQTKTNSAVFHHFPNCKNLPLFEDFSALCHENKKYLLELKERLCIMRDSNHGWKRTICSFLSVWMSFCYIVCSTIWTFEISLGFWVVWRSCLDLKKKL